METQLYPGIAFSPPAALTDNIGAGDTIIPVSDAGSFPPAPNLATIGADEDGETILYAAKTATALSGCARGVEGEARAWSAGEPIARNWTAKDHADLIAAVREAKEASDPAGTAEDVLEGHQEDVAAHGALFSAKQNKLTGQPGQAVGFGADGAAKAVPGWSNPNLLDNWYFVDPINQRGRTTYSGAVYSIDRWRSWETSSEVTIANSYVIVKRQIAQVIEDDIKRSLLGKNVTISLLTDDGKLVEASGIVQYDRTGILVGAQNGDISLILYFDEANTLTFQVNVLNNASVHSAAAKLELGSVQTLACQDTSGNWVLNDPPPDKALELAKCQRYFERSAWNATLAVAINNSELRFCGSYYFKAVKRVAPAITVVAAHEGQQIGLFDTVDYVYITGLQAIEPIAYNQYMFSPRVSDPQSRLVLGRVYQVVIPDNLYNISADL